MKPISVNVSLPKPAVWDGGAVLTAIFKEPVAGRVRLSTPSLDGDRQAGLRVRGMTGLALPGTARKDRSLRGRRGLGLPARAACQSGSPPSPSRGRISAPATSRSGLSPGNRVGRGGQREGGVCLNDRGGRPLGGAAVEAMPPRGDP